MIGIFKIEQNKTIMSGKQDGSFNFKLKKFNSINSGGVHEESTFEQNWKELSLWIYLSIDLWILVPSRG